MKSTSSKVCSSTVRSHAPKVGIAREDDPQATSSRSGSIIRMPFAVREASLP